MEKEQEFENLNIKFIISELHDRWLRRTDIEKFTGKSAFNSFLVATTIDYMLTEDIIDGVTYYKILTDKDFENVRKNDRRRIKSKILQ